MPEPGVEGACARTNDRAATARTRTQTDELSMGGLSIGSAFGARRLGARKSDRRSALGGRRSEVGSRRSASTQLRTSPCADFDAEPERRTPERRAPNADRRPRIWHQTCPNPTGLGGVTTGGPTHDATVSCSKHDWFHPTSEARGDYHGAGEHYRTVGPCVVPVPDPGMGRSVCGGRRLEPGDGDVGDGAGRDGADRGDGPTGRASGGADSVGRLPCPPRQPSPATRLRNQQRRRLRERCATRGDARIGARADAPGR